MSDQSTPLTGSTANPDASFPSKGYAEAAAQEERRLVQAARTGDQQAFAALLSTHGDRLYGMLLHMANGRADRAEEWAQEAWVRAWEKLDHFDGSCRFYTWLYRLARNRVLDLLEKKAPIDADLEELQRLERRVPATPDRMERQDVQEAVRDALQRLPPTEREIILLRDFEGLDYAAIAQRLSCPEGTVKSRLNRARSALRSLLEGLMRSWS